MNFEAREIKRIVREGYQILLRAEASLMLPTEQPQIRNYYEALCEKCMQWAVEVHGEQLRKRFLSLESAAQKARFPMERYRFSMGGIMEARGHAVILCESRLQALGGGTGNEYYRISHVWNLEEETVLPTGQILRAFDVSVKKREVPFRPDGVYPAGGNMIFFKNPTENTPFSEFQIPLSEECLRKWEMRYNN